MNGFTAFVLGLLFCGIVAWGIALTVKKRKKASGPTTGGGTTDKPTEGKPEMNNPE
jgi:hypothetical protein